MKVKKKEKRKVKVKINKVRYLYLGGLVTVLYDGGLLSECRVLATQRMKTYTDNQSEQIQLVFSCFVNPCNLCLVPILHTTNLSRFRGFSILVIYVLCLCKFNLYRYLEYSCTFPSCMRMRMRMMRRTRPRTVSKKRKAPWG